MGTRYAAIGIESVLGTPVTPQRYFESITSMRPNQGYLTQTPISDRFPTKRNAGPYRCRGNIGDFNVEPLNIGYFLRGAFGSVATTNPTSGVYNHVFTPATPLPSYTVRIGAELMERILPGCLINALTVKFPHDNTLMANAEVFSGFPETKGTIGTPSISTLKALNMHESTSVLTIGGASVRDKVFDLEVTFENNIPFQRGNLAARTFNVKRYGLRRAHGKISMYFDDTNQYDAFLAGTEFTLIVRADGLEWITGYKYYLAFELHRCIHPEDAAPNVVSQEDLLVLDCPFEATYDTTGGFNSEIKATLQNSVATY